MNFHFLLYYSYFMTSCIVKIYFTKLDINIKPIHIFIFQNDKDKIFSKYEKVLIFLILCFRKQKSYDL